MQAVARVVAITLSFVSGSQIATAGMYENAVIASNPLAFYQVNEIAGTTMVNSVNPGTYDGTFANVTLNQPGPASEFPYATSASGYTNGTSSSGLYNLPNGGIPALASGASFSVEFFVNNDTNQSSVAYSFLFAKGITGNYLGIGVGGTGSGGVDNLFLSVGGSDYTTSYQFGSDWNLVALTYDATLAQANLYVNGVAIISNQSVTPNTADGNFIWGQRYIGPVGPVSAYFSDISIYDTALSSDIISEHYNIAMTGVPEPSSALLLGSAGLALVIMRRRWKFLAAR